MTAYDVAVVGLGATGSAITHSLARAGARVLGIDTFRPPHARSSSYGDSRLTRLAIAEGEAYIPLALRSHELWRELEADIDTELLVECGWLMAAPHTGGVANHGADDVFAATVQAARTYDIRHDLLDAADLRERFPQFRLGDEVRGYFEHAAGFVRADAAVTAQLTLAERHGATLAYEQVTHVEGNGTGATVQTNRGTYTAGQVVVAAGPWLPELLPVPSLQGLFSVQRQVLHWFDVDGDPSEFAPDRFPTFFLSLGQRDPAFAYGFPSLGAGLKAATETYAEPTTPATVDRTVPTSEVQRLYDALHEIFPDMAPRALRSHVCLYTVTPDSGFVVDRLPEMPQVWVASPCSGHGFKHSAALGEAIAQQLLHGVSTIDLSAFRIDRFSDQN